ncbi:unannotated protein [freshwater metagenome]|uniref:Unannotated protein n=1 Tax=freshwater metagenome TaxID=449393 RepID=A0A6J7D4W7_9ZZZZ
MAGNRAHHLPKGVDRRHPTVHEQERLPVVLANADLESTLIGVGVTNCSTDLETLHLAGEHTVLNNYVGTATFDQFGEVDEARVHVRRSGKRLREGGLEATAIDTPNHRRDREVCCPSCQQPTGLLGNHVQRNRTVLTCPGQCPTERPLRAFLGEDPRSIAAHECGPARPGAGLHGRVWAEVLSNERSQFQTEELATPRRIGAGHQSFLVREP